MNQTKPVDTKALMEEAKTSRDKEAYKLLEKTPSYRIGVGVRIEPPNPPSFFIEVIVKLSTENSEVNLARLEKTLRLLKALQTRGYSLTYQDDTSISCETTTSINEISQEYTTAKSLMNSRNIGFIGS
ncbi:MAG: hypothetical protein ABSC20_09105 [Candidatus Bathyarchaeia archaeon]|jgi:pyruvate formate-lyase activating enzyme-like uncharacterized protein